MKKVLFFLSILAFTVSCSKNRSPEEQLTYDIELIKKYIADNKLTAQSTPEGVYYTIDVQGAGTTKPTLSNIVAVKYKGYLLNGNVFDQSTSAVEFRLSGLIQGWQIGLQKYTKGTKGKLLIPSGYGYGSQATGSIPANSVLIFDIELTDIK